MRPKTGHYPRSAWGAVGNRGARDAQERDLDEHIATSIRYGLLHSDATMQRIKTGQGQRTVSIAPGQLSAAQVHAFVREAVADFLDELQAAGPGSRGVGQ